MPFSTYLRETRPQFLVLTPMCFLVGLGTASLALGGLGNVSWVYAALALFGAISSHVAVNVLNDYHDFKKGLDLKTQPTPFSGGSTILPQGLMTPEGVLVMGIVALAIVGLVGLFFLKVRGWGILPLGLLGLAVVVLYTPVLTRAPFLCLVAPGLGFGPLMVVGTHFVLVGSYDGMALAASLVPGLLVSNLLLINQFPDVEADRETGRLHLPIMIGRPASAYLYGALALAAFAWLGVAVGIELLPSWSLIALFPLPLCLVTIRGAIKYADDIEALIPFLGKNVVYTLATPFLLGLGLLLA